MNYSKFYLLFFFYLCLSSIAAQEVGKASYYSDMFHGRKTAYGEIYDKNKLTAAHKTLAYNSIVRVTRIDNGAYVDVRIIDKGPYIKDRIVDLSKEAAFRLGILEIGQTDVSLEVLKESSATYKSSYYESYSVLENDRKTNAPKPTTTENKTVLTPKGAATPTKKLPPPPPHWTEKGLYKVEVSKPDKGHFALQVGSFESYENALQRIALLQELDYNEVMVYFDKKYFKVLFGPYVDKKDALEIKSELSKNHKIPSFLIDLMTLKGYMNP